MRRQESDMAGLTRRSFGLLAPGIMGLGAMSGASAAEDRFFDSAGVRIHYIEQGAGEPVVLIHGYTVDLNEQWIATGVFPALASSYRVIALDARGHGLSDKPHERSAYGPEMGLDIVRLLDHLGIRRAHIVGYSMGAHIVAQLDHPSGSVHHPHTRRCFRSPELVSGRPASCRCGIRRDGRRHAALANPSPLAQGSTAAFR